MHKDQLSCPSQKFITDTLHVEKSFIFSRKMHGTEQKQALLEYATSGQLREFCECVRNIWKGRLNFTPNQKNQLLASRDIRSQLATCQIPFEAKLRSFISTFPLRAKPTHRIT